MNALLNKAIISTSPILAAMALYFLFGYLGILGWIRLALSASMGVAAANFAQAMTISSLAGTSLYRSHAVRSFGTDTALALAVSIPASLILHARIIYLEFGWSGVFNNGAWAPWMSHDGGVATLFVTFVFSFGVVSLIRLFIIRLTKN